MQRPIVAKVHRGLMYAPFNSPETTHDLKPEWRKALSYVFGTYTPIVIGYAGGDRSLMSFLEEEGTVMRNGVYWCYRGKAGQAKLPDESIQQFLREKHGYFVAIDGFDALMVEIGTTVYGDAIRPGLTAEQLKKKNDGRINQYNEQWNKLNEKPEMKKVLQPMNEAERREEEQREEKEELTYWDYIRRGVRACSDGRRDEAIREYSAAIALEPEEAAAYNNRGIVYDDLGKYEEAIEDYSTAIRLDSAHAVAYNNRGIVYRKQGEHVKAMADYNKAVELDPDYANAYNGRGIVYKELGEREKAIEDYSKAIELTPDDASFYYNRGILYGDLGEYEKAIEDYSKAAALCPGAATYNNWGVAYKNLKDYPKAIESYTKAIELDAGYQRAYRNRAEAYRAIGEDDLAAADEKKAEELK